MSSAAEIQPLAEAIGPYLPLIGVIVGAVIVGAFGVYNRKRGNAEVKVPSVAEAWAEARQLRAERDEVDRKIRNVRDAFDALLALFRAYVTRVQRGGSRKLTAAEETALNLPAASDEDWPTITKAQLDQLRGTESQ